MANLIERRREELGIFTEPHSGLTPIERLIRRRIEDLPPPLSEEEIQAAEELAARQSEANERARRVGVWKSLAAQVGSRYAECRLSNFETATDDQRAIVEGVRRYAAEPWKRVEAGAGLMLIGPKGTGKDHLMVATAREFIKSGVDVAWRSGEELWGELRDLIDSETKTESDWLRRLTHPKVLAISDPMHNGGKSLSDHQSNMLFRVIDRRYRDKRPTWVTLNVDDREEADRVLGAPIADRLVGSCVICVCRWDSYRVSLKI